MCQCCGGRFSFVSASLVLSVVLMLGFFLFYRNERGDPGDDQGAGIALNTLKIPLDYSRKNALSPLGYLESVRIDNSIGLNRREKAALFEFVIETEKLNQLKFGQDFLVSMKCDVFKVIAKLDRKLKADEVDHSNSVFLSDLSASARRLAEQLVHEGGRS